MLPTYFFFFLAPKYILQSDISDFSKIIKAVCGKVGKRAQISWVLEHLNYRLSFLSYVKTSVLLQLNIERTVSLYIGVRESSDRTSEEKTSYFQIKKPELFPCKNTTFSTGNMKIEEDKPYHLPFLASHFKGLSLKGNQNYSFLFFCTKFMCIWCFMRIWVFVISFLKHRVFYLKRTTNNNTKKKMLTVNYFGYMI